MTAPSDRILDFDAINLIIRDFVPFSLFEEQDCNGEIVYKYTMSDVEIGSNGNKVSVFFTDDDNWKPVIYAALEKLKQGRN